MAKAKDRRIDVPGTWSDILKLFSDMAFRRLGTATLSKKTVTIEFESAIGHHEIKLHPTNEGQYMMTECTDGKEKDTRPLTQSMLQFIPTHIQIANRTLGVKEGSSF